MLPKMISFFKHIGLSNFEAYDLDFDYVQRNGVNQNQIDMIIRKETPWEYSLLEEFQNALLTLTYPIDLKFVYTNAPSVFDALSLFSNWYSSIYKGTPSFKVESRDKSTICFVSKSGEKANVEKIQNDFSDFLRWLNYEFILALEEEVDSQQIPAVDVERQNEQLMSIESSLVDEMIVQEKEFKIEKEKKRVFTKGNYKVLGSVAEVLKAGLISVDFEAFTFDGEVKTIKGGKHMLTVGLGDETGAITGRAFENKAMPNDYLEKFMFVPKDPKSFRVRIRGAVELNSYTGKKGIMIHYLDILPDLFERDDLEEEKRVELHLHSKMSAFDGVTDMTRYCKLAAHFGMDAIAITDHAVVQGFPDAQKAAKANNLKAIYGCEFNMFDLHPLYAYNPSPIKLRDATYCVFDFETTGLSRTYDRITEFGAVLVKNNQVVDTIDFFVNPEMLIPQAIVEKTHITQADVDNGLPIAEAVKKMEEFIGDAILVSHNANFDIGFMNEARNRLGLEDVKNPVVDTLTISRCLFPDKGRHSLGYLCKYLGVTSYNEEEAHRADFDANALNDCWMQIINLLTSNNPNYSHADLNTLKTDNPEFLKRLREYHVICLAKNKKGLSSIYKLVSESHTTYLANMPKVPRDLIAQYKEDFLVGSACFNGEIFELAKNGRRKELLETMKFYDYIEVQPVENYSFLVDTNSITQEALIRTLKDIVSAADELDIPVCATGDVHYADESDKFYRDIIISTLAIGEGRHPLNPTYRDKFPNLKNPDQHFRTTGEMLNSFEEWLPKEKAKEIVVTNTRKIASMTEELHPIIEGTTFAPNENLPNSDEKIKNLCYSNFQKKYGDNPNPDVKARLDRELNCIISNGYAVTYYIAHCIIKKANEDGYIVGSRGSVGSSFAATMADITEVNPLAPHYFCPKCKNFEFVDPKLGYKSGYDLPDKVCPECGAQMDADGQNIPFETFLGFNGDKVPDIDLNFPSDYQSKAHDYTRVLLGAKNVFRAGTIETVAQKTAIGYVRGYLEKHQNTLKVEDYPIERISFIASRLLKIKRTTGQHPGGIVVVPANNEVYDFTAIQHPADDKEADWLTTHFDFNSMHDELLKLDLLGHVDPLAMRQMSLVTGVDIRSIPFNDKRVISLFSGPEELHLKENWLNIETGAVGLPEFGTNQGQRMLSATHPHTFNDLLIISGLAHGTDVWTNNAEDLINNGVATLQEVIGCRDDIMTYLISMGIEHKTAFSIMEDIRKGRKLKPGYDDLLKEHGVPDFYIKSCNKIKYLFPRAHATAYVQMAFRVGYFKIYYPLEFYSVFFSVRCDDWDIFSMKEGEQAVKNRITELRSRSSSKTDPLSDKEKSILATLQVALEMIERGYGFGNIDIYKSDATMFTVDKEHNCLIPPFTVLDGLGESAAVSVVEARKGKPFTSQADLLKRTKLSKTNVEDMVRLGALEGLDETNQMSLFSLDF